MLSRRIFTSILLISVITVTIFNELACGLLVTAFIVAGLYEFFTMLEKKGISIYKYFGITMGLVIPLSLVFRFELTKNWELLFIVLCLLSLILMQFQRRNNSGVVVDISTTLFGILYVSWFLSFMIKIRYFPGGIGLFTAVLLITKSGDTGAYLIGTRFGKTPLIPRISPRKSVEGAIGGLIFSILGAFASRPFFPALGGIPLGRENVFSFAQVLFIGLALGILGQLGDLSESLIKRDCQVKDASKILPGLGGALDSIDSLLFTAPAFYFYIVTILK